MTMETKKNIFKEHLRAWLTADKKGRGVIIKMICAVIKTHSKSVSRSFKRVQMHDAGQPEKRGRNVVYGPDVTAALKEVSVAASHPCGENLHAVIPEYVAIFKRDGMWHHSEETTKKLLMMSVATVKRKAEKFSHLRTMIRGKSTTKPGSIKALIPIRSGPWADAPAGTVQLDTVAHCGVTVAGDFIYSVNTTDVATLWGARRAQWNKGKEQTVRSMEQMDADFPYPILEWHPDTGSEFINWFCKGWAEAKGQRLTRSRPNHKNDNCFVEERNGHIVRKWVGWSRLDDERLVVLLNELYDVLTPYLNHFAASKRTVSKERIGSKWKVTREKKSLTPYQRVMARDDVAEEAKSKLRAEHEKLNPLVLKCEVDRRLQKVFDVRKQLAEPKS
jgi:hypothetical protein